MIVEDFSIDTKSVAAVVEELNILLIGSEELQQEVGSKDWVFLAVYLFNEQIKFRSSISLKEYFS